MDFNLNEVQQLLQDSVRRFIERSYRPDQRAAVIQSDRAESAQNWRAFAENGWLGASIPEACGGLGGSVVETALIAHEIGRGLALEPYLGCGVLAPRTLLACGGSALGDELLTGVLDGSCRLALAYAEAQSYGMPVAPALRAAQVAGGYRLDGVKTLVLGGRHADAFIVSAAVDSLPAGSGTTLFLVRSGTAGLARRALPLHDGSWAAELTFTAVFAPDEDLLSPPGEGMAALLDGLTHGTAALCAELVGAMEKAIDITAEYLRVRKQFGVAIGSFQALQHRMADMAAEMELARSMLYALLAAMDGADATERQRIASQAKALIGRAAKWVCGQAIQLHGGIGMTNEYSVGHYFKRAVVADIALGSSERHEAFCAQTLRLNAG